MAIIRGPTMDEMLAELRQQVDANGNGIIDLSEAGKALEKIRENAKLLEEEKKALRRAMIKEALGQTSIITIAVFAGTILAQIWEVLFAFGL